MVIVEGPDGSGKSTLIDSLIERGYERCRLKSMRGGIGGVQGDGSGDGIKGWAGTEPALLAYTKKVTQSPDLTAFDRFHLSEVVYGPILRQKQELNDDGLYLLNSLLRKRQVPVVLCLPPFEVTLANTSRVGRERPSYQTPEFLRRAYQEFERLAPFATILYDFTHDKIPTF